MATAPKSLGRTRDAVAPVLAAASRTLAPELRRVVEYHFGWLDAEGRPTARSGGKALRPTLALLSAEATGSAADVALAGAAAVELVHDFTLLHDDVMDRDTERRHRPTAWSVFGDGPAICGGDALLLLAHRVLLADESPHRIEALDALVAATDAVIAGQAVDLAFEGRTDVSVDDYLRMSAGKTGALLGCAASIGAVLAGAPAPQVAALREFGAALGLAFQAVDDWLGVWGTAERTGKPVASDLRRRKCALPVVAALEHGGPYADELREFLREPDEPDAAAVERAFVCLEATGAGDAARAVARREYVRARRALDSVPLEASAHAELHELAGFVVERDR
jgi:geranylgeranyl diphosphate synthase type I